MAVDDVTKVSIRGYRGANPIIMTFQYRTGLSIGDKDLELWALATALEEDLFTDNFATPLLAYFPTKTYFYDMILRDALNPQIGLDYVFAAQYEGQLAGDPLQRDACMLVMKKTNLIGRRSTGKNYLAVGTETQMTGGLWGADFMNDVKAAMENAIYLENVLPNFSFNMCVWSETYVSSADVTSFKIIPEPRRQKRRRAF